MNTMNSICNNSLMSDMPSTDMSPLKGLGLFRLDIRSTDIVLLRSNLSSDRS